MLQHQAPDDGASAEDEGERADEDHDDVEEEPKGVVTCRTRGGSRQRGGHRDGGVPGTDATSVPANAAPTPAEDAGIFALLDVSPVVEADFHPAAVRLVVKRDLGEGGGPLVEPAAPRTVACTHPSVPATSPGRRAEHSR